MAESEQEEWLHRAKTAYIGYKTIVVRHIKTIVLGHSKKMWTYPILSFLFLFVCMHSPQ